MTRKIKLNADVGKKTIKSIGSNRKIADSFQALGCNRPLIGIVFVGNGELAKKLERSKTIQRIDKVVPAGCSFWEMAATKLFYTDAESHSQCSVGMYTHNLLRNKQDEARLMGDISLMKKIDYVRMSEVSAIPALKKKSRYVVYGPWAEFQKPTVKKLGIVPDVGLVFSDAEKGLILSEAVSRVDGEFPPAMGRPACAGIPQAINSKKATVSFGCCGARAYVLGLKRETEMWVLPEKNLMKYAEAISTFTQANQILSLGHKKREKSFQRGGRLELSKALSR